MSNPASRGHTVHHRTRRYRHKRTCVNLGSYSCASYPQRYDGMIFVVQDDMPPRVDNNNVETIRPDAVDNPQGQMNAPRIINQSCHSWYTCYGARRSVVAHSKGDRVVVDGPSKPQMTKDVETQPKTRRNQTIVENS
mmetsp:Transcript_39808/g.82765  ORF Transcript_39808/g.82765 Transcript_39808/m.82765 type:complete len:137 (-) Transcript_39808:1016-1426(-)